MLVLPLDGTLLYVEPIYLQSETAAYPELRLVILMHNDTLAYGKSLDEALGKLYGDQEETQSFVATGDTGERAARELARLKEIFFYSSIKGRQAASLLPIIRQKEAVSLSTSSSGLDS